MDELQVGLREVRDSDIETFYLQQADAEAAAMAAFPSRDRPAHHAHWVKILANESNITRTIVIGSADAEVVAGNMGSWEHEGLREVGYWVGHEFWGRGVATAALRLFVDVVGQRPLYAWAVAHNGGSQRVLEKSGFVYQRDDENDFRVFRLD